MTVTPASVAPPLLLEELLPVPDDELVPEEDPKPDELLLEDEPLLEDAEEPDEDELVLEDEEPELGEEPELEEEDPEPDDDAPVPEEDPEVEEDALVPEDEEPEPEEDAMVPDEELDPDEDAPVPEDDAVPEEDEDAEVLVPEEELEPELLPPSGEPLLAEELSSELPHATAPTAYPINNKVATTCNRPIGSSPGEVCVQPRVLDRGCWEVHVATGENDHGQRIAPPRRIERPANGLGMGRDQLEITAHRENKPDRETRSDEISPVEDPPVHSLSEPVQSERTESPTDGELERAIVAAVTGGAFDVAKVLAGVLDERRRARTPANVVPLRRPRR